jgi:hypothetical protein
MSFIIVVSTWFIIIVNTTLATTDLYPGGHSREECEQTIEKGRGANPQPLAPDIRIECIESSQLGSWYQTNHLPGPPRE